MSNSRNVRTITFAGGGEPTVRKGYEYVVEQALESKLLTSIATNGSYLNKLDNLPVDTVKKLSWVGVAIDSGDPAIYEKIRRSSTKGMFERVKENISWLASINNRVDVKVLLHPDTASEHSLHQTFKYAKDVNARMLYFRIALLKSGMYIPSESVYELIDNYSKFYGVSVQVNKSRLTEKSYSKCHALYMLPVFAADGLVYLCCENRGNPKFALGSWLDDEFWLNWCSDAHYEIYNDIDARLCLPCRPHTHNIEVENSINSQSFHQDLFL